MNVYERLRCTLGWLSAASRAERELRGNRLGRVGTTVSSPHHVQSFMFDFIKEKEKLHF